MPESELSAYRQLPMWKRRIALMSTVPREGRLEDTYRFEAEKFANHQVPAAFFVGGESPEVLRRATEIARAALPNNRVVILPGQRHVAMDSAPELFVSEVRRFLLDADLPVGRLHEQAVKA